MTVCYVGDEIDISIGSNSLWGGILSHMLSYGA